MRSTPEALRVVPGVVVQQTAHGQASPYVRGLTGQQVLLTFDGVRLNNGIFRQGPNQYFFTVDSETVEALHVVRGSASTRLGADALGGAILAVPREPTIDPTRDEFILRPRAITRLASQDRDLGGRAELDAQLGRHVGFLGGIGYRDAGPLRGGGIVCNLAGEPCVPTDDPATRVGVPMVPFVEADGRTQRGTGFRALSWDGRLVWQPSPEVRITAAAYGWHQFDTPRTDQCPAPFAPGNDCLVYLEQTRTLGLVSADLRPTEGALAEMRVVLSWQHVHEHRLRDRPTAFVQNGFRDTIDTYGLVMRGRTRLVTLAPGVLTSVHFGADGSFDRVRSDASITFTDVELTVDETRGQYVDRAAFGQLAAWSELETIIDGTLALRGGLRALYAGARAGADVESGTRAVRSDFGGLVARVGAEVIAAPELTLLLNVDQGYRAPNLDDLTSRQQAGPGFQFENPDLREERSTTLEIGARAHTLDELLTFEAWAYAMVLEGAMTRVTREASECPPATPQCNASWSRYQLVNAPAASFVLGSEVAARVFVRSLGLAARASLAATWGDGPSSTGADLRVPLSRIPPVNGLVDLRWQTGERGLVLGGTFRWAIDQTRLAPADASDARIPLGGTPGYGVVDLRAGWAFERWLQVNVVLENVLDTAYRVHGSSINGPGRGLLARLEVGL